MRFFTAMKILFCKRFAENFNKQDIKIQDNSAQILGLFQRDGRLIDFLQEDITNFSDEQVGAAARDVHKGCAQVLKDYFSIVPVIAMQENSKIPVDSEFDAKEIKIIGNMSTKGNKSGILRHHGWKLAKSDLPQTNPVKANIIQPAQVEIE